MHPERIDEIRFDRPVDDVTAQLRRVCADASPRLIDVDLRTAGRRQSRRASDHEELAFAQAPTPMADDQIGESR